MLSAVPWLGLGTTFQALPSQCSVRVWSVLSGHPGCMRQLPKCRLLHLLIHQGANCLCPDVGARHDVPASAVPPLDERARVTALIVITHGHRSPLVGISAIACR